MPASNFKCFNLINIFFLLESIFSGENWFSHLLDMGGESGDDLILSNILKWGIKWYDNENLLLSNELARKLMDCQSNKGSGGSDI